MTPPAASTLAVELVPIDSLHPDPANPMRISDDEPSIRDRFRTIESEGAS